MIPQYATKSIVILKLL